MDLKDTVTLMLSPDYRERFKAEYYQLDIRIKKLHDLIDKWDAGQLDFSPKASRDLLHGQLIDMITYRNRLRARAVIEGIQLDYRS
ncbi:MAG TPA: hypothetical protein IAC45_02885 [Candidatus Aphodousia faecavium]|nr:hypothetical protein [Candidatus Aphodousia faecavium]